MTPECQRELRLKAVVPQWHGDRDTDVPGPRIRIRLERLADSRERPAARGQGQHLVGNPGFIGHGVPLSRTGTVSVVHCPGGTEQNIGLRADGWSEIGEEAYEQLSSIRASARMQADRKCLTGTNAETSDGVGLTDCSVGSTTYTRSEHQIRRFCP
jgi:hypothetical protein